MLTTPQKMNLSERKNNIQILLSQSYSVYMFSFGLGLVLDLLIDQRINSPLLNYIGLMLILLASILIYWAQTVNKKPAYLPDGSRNFALGPYAFTRHPTYLGLFLVMIGAGLVMSSYAIILTSILAFVIAVRVFMTKEEARHIAKYKDQYLNYMKKTPKVL